MRKQITRFLLCWMVFFAGCNGEISTQKKQYVLVGNTFAALVEELTLCREMGMIGQQDWDNIKFVSNGAKPCFDGWYDYLQDPNDPNVVPVWLSCINGARNQLLQYLTKAQGGD